MGTQVGGHAGHGASLAAHLVQGKQGTVSCAVRWVDDGHGVAQLEPGLFPMEGGRTRTRTWWRGWRASLELSVVGVSGAVGNGEAAVNVVGGVGLGQLAGELGFDEFAEGVALIGVDGRGGSRVRHDGLHAAGRVGGRVQPEGDQ